MRKVKTKFPWCDGSMHKVRTGFTLVELSLSIAFIAILSITVVLIITNAISSYHRGLTLNQINTTGMELVDDLRAAVQNSPVHSVKSECKSIYTVDSNNSGANVVTQCENDGGRNFVSVVKKAKVDGVSRSGQDVPIYGAFCTGLYSYIWNSGYFFADYKINNSNVSQTASLKYKVANGSGGTSDRTIPASGEEPFKLLKIADDERAVCKSATRGTKSGAKGLGNRYNYVNDLNDSSRPAEFDITNYNAIAEQPYDVLSGSKALAIYDLSAATPAESSTFNNMFYSVSFVLGTIQGGANVLSAGDFCRPPEERSDRENFDYCAINKFNFAAQANGGTK